LSLIWDYIFKAKFKLASNILAYYIFEPSFVGLFLLEWYKLFKDNFFLNIFSLILLRVLGVTDIKWVKISLCFFIIFSECFLLIFIFYLWIYELFVLIYFINFLLFSQSLIWFSLSIFLRLTELSILVFLFYLFLTSKDFSFLNFLVKDACFFMMISKAWTLGSKFLLFLN